MERLKVLPQVGQLTEVPIVMPSDEICWPQKGHPCLILKPAFCSEFGASLFQVLTILNPDFKKMGKRQNVVGAQVRSLRSARGWSQETYAAKCQVDGWDISRGTLSKIEAGLRRVTDAEMFHLAKTLDVPVSDLFRKMKVSSGTH